MLNRLGRYTIEVELGKGGMGTVYRARDERLGKTVALKVLSEAQAGTSDSRQRLRREARAAAILNHPGIVAVYDYDEENGVPFIAYEYVEGKTLDQVIADEKLSAERMADIGAQVAAGLAYAHERGILHRDVKPQNIMVMEDGRVKILDFGLAKKTDVALRKADGQQLDTTTVETAVGTIVGTVQYMSPEQIAGEELDGRSDVFSLGITLYEMATGKNPFHGQSFASTVGKIMSPEPPPFSGERRRVPADLQDIILRCLRKKREERYPSARILQENLEQVCAGASSARPSSRGRRRAEIAESVIPRSLARSLLILLQALYLTMYGFALYYQGDVFQGVGRALTMISSPPPWTTVRLVMTCATTFLVTACCGVAVRLYFVASVGFDDPDTGRQFRRLFPLLFLLDELWALSPLLLIGKWPPGVTFFCMAVLAYLPFSHRNLIRASYPE
jgi:serine/threonine protein kinase